MKNSCAQLHSVLEELCGPVSALLLIWAFVAVICALGTSASPVNLWRYFGEWLIDTVDTCTRTSAINRAKDTVRHTPKLRHGLPSTLFAFLSFPISRILAQSSANLVTVTFNLFNNPATFDVIFEDDLGDKFNSGTFTQKDSDNPGVTCNVGLF
ncbi:hypothetical protein C8R42DRAFT_20476 [Lentinula raphanica]|nr:hypothetical protein C8R42DRAFT_20476 [Lentinula raphanica]